MVRPGRGMNDGVRAIAASGSDVIAGGYFTQAGGGDCNHVASWNGASWSMLTSGADSSVYAVASGGAGVYVGGVFDSAGGIMNTSGIARWNDPTWSRIRQRDGGASGYSVNAIAVSGSDVVVGGIFDSAGGVPVTNIAKWNSGSGWSALAPEISDNGEVYAIAVSGRNVYMGGAFQDNDTGAPNHIAKWSNGSGWSALGQGTDGKVYAIAVSGTDVYVGGSFNTAGGQPMHGIAKYSDPSFYLYLPLSIRSH